MKLFRIVFAMLLLAATAHAQDPAPAVDAARDGAAGSSAGVPEPAAGTAPAPDAKTPAKPSSDGRFKPSEKISEDLSVSFPADI